MGIPCAAAVYSKVKLAADESVCNGSEVKHRVVNNMPDFDLPHPRNTRQLKWVGKKYLQIRLRGAEGMETFVGKVKVFPPSSSDQGIPFGRISQDSFISILKEYDALSRANMNEYLLIRQFADIFGPGGVIHESVGTTETFPERVERTEDTFQPMVMIMISNFVKRIVRWVLGPRRMNIISRSIFAYGSENIEDEKNDLLSRFPIFILYATQKSLSLDKSSIEHPQAFFIAALNIAAFFSSGIVLSSRGLLNQKTRKLISKISGSLFSFQFFILGAVNMGWDIGLIGKAVCSLVALYCILLVL